MDHTLDPRSPVPLYEQIAERFRLAIASSELGAGETLPSVRRLATSLRVNPSTVVQAYRDLESGGWVETRHGAGTFVREQALERRNGERAEQARKLVRRLLEDGARTGLTPADLKRAFEEETGNG